MTGRAAVVVLALAGCSLTHDPGSYSDGRAVLAQGSSPYAIAADVGHVYWTEPDLGTVMRVPTSGGAAEALATGVPGAKGIAVDTDGTVYFTTNVANGAVIKASPGQQATPIATSLGHPLEIAVTSAAVYYAEREGPSITRVNKDGSSAITRTAGDVLKTFASFAVMTADENNVFLGGDASGDFGGSRVSKLGTDLDIGRDLACVAGVTATPTAIASDGTTLFAASKDGAIAQWDKTCGGITKKAGSFVDSHTQTPTSIVTDASAVYWPNVDGAVMRKAKAGGTPALEVSGPGTPGAIAVAGANIYWVAGGAILKAAKK
jgi:hypothetical protein